MLKKNCFEGVTQFVLGRDVGGTVLYWCSAYLVDDLLIDSGCPATARELLEALEGRPLAAVANTHYHEDHTGGNALLARARGIRLLAPELSLRKMAQGFYMHDYRVMVWDKYETCLAEPLGDEVRSSGHSFRVIPSPGHSADHVVLWEEKEGWAFVGDLYFSEAPKTANDEENLNQTLASLERLRSLGPRVLFNGLGHIVEPALPSLDKAIATIAGIRDRTLELAARGLTPPQIVKEIHGRESTLLEITQKHHSYENFIRGLLKGE